MTTVGDAGNAENKQNSGLIVNFSVRNSGEHTVTKRTEKEFVQLQ
jgi:hypothetical protein